MYIADFNLILVQTLYNLIFSVHRSFYRYNLFCIVFNFVIFQFDDNDLKLKTQTTSLRLKESTSEICHFLPIPDFIVNVILITLS